MYDTITEFMTTFSADYPLLWALLVVAVVACTSLLLFVFWETALRIFLLPWGSRKNSRRPSR